MTHYFHQTFRTHDKWLVPRHLWNLDILALYKFKLEYYYFLCPPAQRLQAILLSDVYDCDDNHTSFLSWQKWLERRPHFPSGELGYRKPLEQEHGLPCVFCARADLIVIITSAEGGYVFGSVCLSSSHSSCLRPSDNWKSCERILTKFLWRGRAWPRDQWFQFWWRSASLCGSGSPLWITIRIGKNWRSAEVCALWVLLVCNFIKLVQRFYSFF